jgi:hypothetical protein
MNLRWFIIYTIAAVGTVFTMALFGGTSANFIIERFSQNVLTYNTPAPIVTTYPLAPLTFPIDTFSRSATMVALAAFALAKLLGNRWVAGLALIVALFIAPSYADVLMLGLALSGLWALRERFWTLGGALLGASILAEPMAIPLAIFALLLVIREGGSAGRYALPAALIPIIGYTANTLATGTTIYVNVAGGVIPVGLSVTALMAIIFRFADIRRNPYAAVLVAWSASAGIIAFSGSTLPSVAVIPGAIAVLSLTPLPIMCLIIAFADASVNLSGNPLYRRDLGIIPEIPDNGFSVEAIIAHMQSVDPNVVIASDNVLMHSLFINRPVLDTSGYVQLDIAPNDYDAQFFIQHAPDALILRDGAQVAWENFATTYALTSKEDGFNLYQRVVNFTPLTDRPVEVNFGASIPQADLYIVGAGVAESVRPGDLLRVRVDWRSEHPPTRDVEIRLSLKAADGSVIAGTVNRLPPGELGSTYHLIPLPFEIAPGELILTVDIGVNGGYFGERELARITV